MLSPTVKQRLSAPGTRGALAGLALAIVAVAGLEYAVVGPRADARDTLTSELATVRASNDEIERVTLSAEASAAFLARKEETDRLWEADLERLPPEEKAADTFDAIETLARSSGCKVIAFAPEGALPDSGPAAPPAPGAEPSVEVRKVRVTLHATMDALKSFLASVSTFDRLINLDSYDVTARPDLHPYTCAANLRINAYFKRRPAVTAPTGD